MRAVDALGSFGPIKPRTITPSDSTTYNPPLRGLLIEEQGAVKIGYSNGETDTFADGALLVGVVYPFYDIAMVYDTGTDSITIHCGKDD